MKRSLFTSRRSEQFLTGKNRVRGTLIPCAFLKYLIADPAAVSSYRCLSKLKSLWYTERLNTCKADRPSSNVLLVAMISSSKPSFSTTRLRADRKGCYISNKLSVKPGMCLPLRLIQRLLVLKILNLRSEISNKITPLNTSLRYTYLSWTLLKIPAVLERVQEVELFRHSLRRHIWVSNSLRKKFITNESATLVDK
jgi:hypothetical protein